MRGVPRRSRGGGGRRDLSPPPYYTTTTTTTRDPQRSEWRPNPYRVRRSQSPSMRDQPRRRSLSGGRRNAAVERRDYNGPDSSKRHGHGKQHQQCDRSPPPLPSQSHGGRNALAFGDAEGGGGGYGSFHRKYLQTDPPSDEQAEANLKTSRSVNAKDFHHSHVTNGGGQASSSGVGLDRQSMLVQKSMYLDDGSVRTFFSLPPGPGSYSSDASGLNSNSIGGGGGGSTLRIGVRGSEELCYHERLREKYVEGEEKIYARDAPYSGMPPSQPRAFAGASSSGTMKDDLLASYRDDFRLSSDGLGRSNGVGKIRDDILGRDGFSQMQLFDPVKRRTLSPPVRDEPRDYNYSEFRQSGRGDHGFSPLEDPYRKMTWGPRGEYRETLGSGFVDPFGNRVDDIEASPKIIREARLWDHHPSLEDGDISDYRDMNRIHEEYLGGSGSGSLMFGTKTSHANEFADSGESYRYGRDAGVVGYRGRSRSPPLSGRHVDIYGRDFGPPQGRMNTENLEIYDPSSERVMKRKYIMDDERSILPNTGNSFKQITEPSGNDELWANEDRVGSLLSKKFGFGHPQHKMSSHGVSGPEAWLRSDNSIVGSRGGRDFNLKRRLRPGPSDFHGPFSVDRRQDFYRRPKVWKKGYEDRHVTNAHDGNVLEDEAPLVKSDPPEDSEEFKQQVQKAFLRFSKLLNENPHQQKIYQEQGKTRRLLCCVCGSRSKEFVDTHSLVTHAFHSLKVGLRTDHLGLHKALCVLMGWNWLVAPDTSRVYQTGPAAEVKALKEDLILWPPLVIVHNGSIGNKNITNAPKVVTVEGLEAIFRGLGFEAGKTRVCRGKPANQSVFLVKFMPTFSGLQEADRLHKYYADNNRGRKEFQEITSNKLVSGCRVEAQVEKMEELLYGYMGTVEDLDKLDSETKRRCLVKSKKEIEAIADAPLKIDE